MKRRRAFRIYREAVRSRMKGEQPRHRRQTVDRAERVLSEGFKRYIVDAFVEVGVTMAIRQMLRPSPMLELVQVTEIEP